MKLKAASLSRIPFLVIKIAVPSQISANSSFDFISGCVLSANNTMNLSSLDFAIIKKSSFLSFAIIGDFTSFNFFKFNLHSFARIFSAFADCISSNSPVCFSSSKTDRFFACSLVMGTPRNFITIKKQVRPLSCFFSIFRLPFKKNMQQLNATAYFSLFINIKITAPEKPQPAVDSLQKHPL